MPAAVATRIASELGRDAEIVNDREYSFNERSAYWGNYLNTLKNDCNLSTAVLITEPNKCDYGTEGFIKYLNLRKEPHDSWYYKFINTGKQQEINFDTNNSDKGELTVFVNQRIQSSSGKLLGCLALGVSAAKVQKTITELEKRYHVNIAFIDPKWSKENSTNGRALTNEEKSLLNDLKGGNRLAYTTTEKGFIMVRQIDLLNWYMVISYDNTVILGQVFSIMKNCLLGLLGIALFTLIAIFFTAGRQQHELVTEAADLIADMEDETRAKSSFLANMSHEIRTPINSIFGLNTMILRTASNPKVRGYAKDVQRAGNVLLSLINDILDMSKIESGKMSIVPVEYDPALLLNDVVSMARTRAVGKPLVITCDVDTTLPTLLVGDDVRIRQIMMNLLTNAVKYSDEGTVTVKVSWKKENDTAHISIAVVDTGIGMKPEDLARINEKFIRFDTRKNRLVEGAGLGLTITSRLLELMGTKLEAESTYGVGSCFHFDIDQPIADATPIGDLSDHMGVEENDDEEYTTLFTAPGAKVLVADDNVMNLKVFCNLIGTDTGIFIETAMNGVELLEASRERKYDLIFTDHMMPVMDGVEAFKALRQETDNPNVNTPVILLTANAISGAKEEYLSIGFNGYLSKPIDSNQLEKMTKEMLPPELIKPGKKVAREAEAKNYADELTTLDGFNFPAASKVSANKEAFLDILADFANSASRELEKLNSAYESLPESLDDYRITVHAMKSNAAMAGAFGVSLLARILEKAAAAKDLQTIHEVHASFGREWLALPELLKTMPELSGRFEKVAPQKKNKPLDEDLFNDALADIKEALDDFDSECAQQIVGTLLTYDHPDDTLAWLELLQEKLNDFDIDGAKELLENKKG